MDRSNGRSTKALAQVPPERIVSISYSTSRLLSVWLQHHVLIIVREP